MLVDFRGGEGVGGKPGAFWLGVPSLGLEEHPLQNACGMSVSWLLVPPVLTSVCLEGAAAQIGSPKSSKS